MHDNAWEEIFKKYNIDEHNFDEQPFIITAEQIKSATYQFKTTGEREVRILCKQDRREDRPEIFKKHGLFLLPIQNGKYAIVKGEGYVDIPEIKQEAIEYKPKLDFVLDTSKIGNSEMQHLDFAYATSVIRTFLDDPSLVLTIRGRKRTPKKGFSFFVGKHRLKVKSVQTEVDAGYEGRNKVVLIEAKREKVNNVIIRQLFYPLKQWSEYTKKEVVPLFFEKEGDCYLFLLFKFEDINDYNSIKLVKTGKYRII